MILLSRMNVAACIVVPGAPEGTSVRNRMRIARPRNSGARRPRTRLTNRLKLRPGVGSKVGRVLNLDLVFFLEILHVFGEALLADALGDVAGDVVERLDGDFVSLDEVEAGGLLHRIADAAGFQDKDCALDRVGIRTLAVDDAEVAAFRG